MQERISFNASGRISIYLNNSLVYESKNTILPLAKELIVEALASNPLASIDEMGLYLAAVEEAVTPISLKSTLNGDEVHFEASFSAESYQGNIDAVRLLSTNLGPVAEVTGLALVKGNEILLLTWNIKLN